MFFLAAQSLTNKKVVSLNSDQIVYLEQAEENGWPRTRIKMVDGEYYICGMDIDTLRRKLSQGKEQ